MFVPYRQTPVNLEASFERCVVGTGARMALYKAVLTVDCRPIAAESIAIVAQSLIRRY